MTGDLYTIDRQPIEESLEQWRAEQQELTAEYQESLDALDAYQKHLDTWQNQLAAEREELTNNRATLVSEQEKLAHDRAQLESDRQAAGNESEQVTKLREQLGEARDKVATLSADLLVKAEELRTLDNKRAELATQIEILRVREQNLSESLENEKKHLADQQAQWNVEMQQLRDVSDHQPLPVQSEPKRERSNDPVVGSIVAQFNKLRQQQALGRRPPVNK
jgi:chromosome segregation ATPase